MVYCIKSWISQAASHSFVGEIKASQYEDTKLNVENRYLFSYTHINYGSDLYSRWLKVLINEILCPMVFLY